MVDLTVKEPKAIDMEVQAGRDIPFHHSKLGGRDKADQHPISAITGLEEALRQAGNGEEKKEVDPTVPEWAKKPNKPTYTAEEVGALPASTKIPGKTSDLVNDSGYITDGENNIFIALYGETTHQEVYEASQSGKIVIMYRSGSQSAMAFLSVCNGVSATFKGFTGANTVKAYRSYSLQASGNVWSISQETMLTKNDLKTDLSTDSTDSTVPSSKAVCDAIARTSEELSGEIADKVSKSGITLGLHSDGKYYIFVDGVPVGTGFKLSNG